MKESLSFASREYSILGDARSASRNTIVPIYRIAEHSPNVYNYPPCALSSAQLTMEFILFSLAGVAGALPEVVPQYAFLPSALLVTVSLPQPCLKTCFVSV